MEEAPENGKELSDFAHANGINEWTCCYGTYIKTTSSHHHHHHHVTVLWGLILYMIFLDVYLFALKKDVLCGRNMHYSACLLIFLFYEIFIFIRFWWHLSTEGSCSSYCHMFIALRFTVFLFVQTKKMCFGARNREGETDVDLHLQAGASCTWHAPSCFRWSLCLLDSTGGMFQHVGYKQVSHFLTFYFFWTIIFFNQWPGRLWSVCVSINDTYCYHPFVPIQRPD